MSGNYFAKTAFALVVITIIVLVIAAINGNETILGVKLENMAQIVAGLALVIWLTQGVAGKRRSQSGSVNGIKAAAIWLGAGLLLILAYSYRDDVSNIGARFKQELLPTTAMITTSADGRQKIIRFNKDQSGHFTLNGRVNNISIDFMLDTGASTTTLTSADAARAGLTIDSSAGTRIISTANGITTATSTTVRQLAIGSINRNNFQVMVARPGQLDVSLLGMNFLQTLSGFQVKGNKLELYP